MWIERLEFIGFGNLTGQRIDFGSNKLSVVVQPNEYGKSTISEAILAVLYGYPPAEGELNGASPGMQKKPLSGAAFKACMDVNTDGRRMRLIRNFVDRSLQVLDLSKDLGKADSDITAEFAALIANDEFGTYLTGLSRELFQSTCMLGQRQLGSAPFAGDRQLSSILLNIADSGGATTNVFEAIARIEDALEQFSYKGKTQSLQFLLDGMQEQSQSLREALNRLELERKVCEQDMDRLHELDERLELKAKEVAADEYFHLCLEAADTDNRIAHAQEKMRRIEALEAQQAGYQNFAAFPIESQKAVDELWMKRQARRSDLSRLENEVKTKTIHSQIEDLAVRERGDGLSEFTIEDGQILTGLARSLQQSTEELQELKGNRESEYIRVQNMGVDLQRLGGIRSSLLQLERRDLDDAHAFYAMVVSARERAGECERAAEAARATVKEIAELRYRLCTVIDKVFWSSLLASGLLVIPLAYFFVVRHHTDGFAPVIATLYCIACLAALVAHFVNKRVDTDYRADQEEQARLEEHKQQNAAQELVSKAAVIEQRLEDLAKKAGLRSSKHLLRNMQEYALSAAQLKELDLLEHMVQARQTQIEKLKKEIAQYFTRSNRHVEQVNPSEALKLAEAVNQALDDRRRSQSFDVFDHRQSEIRFLSDDIKDIDAQLVDFFQKAGLFFNTVEEGFFKFSDGVAGYRRWEALKSELERMKEDSAADTLPPELPKIVERLESKRGDIWGRIQQLMAANPEIAALPPPVGDSMISSMGKEMSDLRSSLDELRRERDDLIVQIRAAMKANQDAYLQALEDLEAVDEEMERVKRVQTSLLLSRDTFAKLAEENHSVWANKLTDISREMLKHLGTEYECLEFDASLNIAVRRKGQREPLKQWHIANQLSSGTREQLHWLARMAVVRYLSNSKALPVVLDEPFSEFDDERFLKIMRFLINTISGTNQVLVFSCHQQRHEWLLEHLDPLEQEKIELCRLAPLKSDTSAFAKR